MRSTAWSWACRTRAGLRWRAAGATAVAWTLEVREFGMWVPHRTRRRRLVPFWRPARTEYKQNDVITKAEPAAVD